MTDDVRAFPAWPGSMPKIDTRLANVARAWNYMVGGKDNFEADREAARQLMEVAPVIRIAAPASRAFLGRAVRYLAAEAGIRQFLDIGTGLPTAGNTHEIAQAVAPECRVVYVDNDPVVLVHARALLTSDPAGATSYVDADARDPDTIVSQAGATLDFGQPVAIMMVDLLNFIDDEAADSIVSRLTAAVVPGSYLAIMHPGDPALRRGGQEAVNGQEAAAFSRTVRIIVTASCRPAWVLTGSVQPGASWVWRANLWWSMVSSVLCGGPVCRTSSSWRPSL